MLLLMFSLPSFATAYPNNFPSDKTGITGGCYIVAHVGNSEVTIILPVSYRNNYFSFATNGELFNITNSTLSGKLYYNNQLYNIRWQAWSTAQFYYPSGAYYQWTDITIANVTDTNMIFDTTNRAWANDSIYLETKDKIMISCELTIIFLLFLGWFLWHRQSLKS